MNLRKFQDEVHEWEVNNFGRQAPWMPLLGVGEEVGELQHAYLKMAQGIRGTELEHLAQISDAVGDILVFLAAFCSLIDVDLEAAVTTCWSEVKERNWRAFPIDGKTR